MKSVGEGTGIETFRALIRLFDSKTTFNTRKTTVQKTKFIFFNKILANITY